MKKVLSIILALSVLITMLVVMPLTANANEKDIAVTGALDTSKCLNFDVTGTGWTNYNKIGFYIYNVTDNKEFKPWGSKTLFNSEETNPGVWSYDPEANGFPIEDGKHYFVIFVNYNSGKDTTAVGFSSSWLGCTAYCDGTTEPSPVDTNRNLLVARWNNHPSQWIIGNCTYSIEGSVLTISGNGSMGNFNDSYYNSVGLFYSGITQVIIEDGVTSIGTSVFANCKYLTNVTLGKSIESIGASAFYNCNSLTGITIPSSVEIIGNKAFGYYDNKEGFGEQKVKNFTIYGYKNSEAQRYADDNNFTFVALDDEPFDPTKTTDREIFGDIDGDGDITIVDTTFLQRYVVGVPTPYPIGEKRSG